MKTVESARQTEVNSTKRLLRSEDLLKKAHAGELQCHKCGVASLALENVRVEHEYGGILKTFKTLAS